MNNNTANKRRTMAAHFYCQYLNENPEIDRSDYRYRGIGINIVGVLNKFEFGQTLVFPNPPTEITCEEARVIKLIILAAFEKDASHTALTLKQLKEIFDTITAAIPEPIHDHEINIREHYDDMIQRIESDIQISGEKIISLTALLKTQ